MRSWLALLAVTGALAVPTTPRTLDERGLTGDCSTRIIQQKANPLCKQSCGPNFTPQYDGSCLCKAPFQANGAACSPVCTNGFSLSQDLTQCICAPRKFTSLDGKTCSNNCPAGQFGGVNNQCTPCSANVKTCKDANTALTCNSGYFLNKGACVKQCPLSTYVDSTNTCRACADSDASSCKDGGATSATACMTKYLVNGQCLDGDSLPNGYYADPTTHTAKQCAPGVKSCTCGDANCATACGKDSNGNQLFLNFDGTCVSQCAAGSYNDPHTDACLKCDSTALTCDVNGALTCGKDSVGTQLYLTPTKKCILAAAGVPAYYPDDGTFTFKPCLDGVTSCVGGGAGDALTCGTRSDGTTLFFNGNNGLIKRDVVAAPTSARPLVRRVHISGTCVEAASCPQATWADSITNVCTACDANETSCKGNGQGQALSCASGTYLSKSGDCLSADACKASGAFWPDSNNNVCSTCDAGEAACTGNGAGLATACATNSAGKQLFLFQGNCYTSDACPAATYPDNNSKTCAACDAGALTCTGPHAALTCGTDSTGTRLFLNINGDCVASQNCDSSTYADYATRKCESCTLIDPDAKTCTSPTVLSCSTKFFFQSSCIDPCPTRMFGNPANHVCTPCADPDALTCDASGALSCNTLYLSQKACVPACPTGTYPNGHVCTPCTDTYGSGATTCDASQVLSCNSGFYLTNGRCTSCSATWPWSTTCTASGPTACATYYQLDAPSNTCVLHCPDGFDWPSGSVQTGMWPDGKGSCRICLDRYATKCSQTNGKTTQCANEIPGFAGNPNLTCPNRA